MPKISKPYQRSLNDAFIALSDEDESTSVNESATLSGTASSSQRNFIRKKVNKTATKDKTRKNLLRDNAYSSIEQSSYSPEYLRRNYNLQSPRELYPKDKKSLPKQRGKLKRFESLSAYDESQKKTQNACSTKTRGSVGSNNSPLLDISNIETPEFSRTFFNKLKSRMSYPGCTTVKLSSQRHTQCNNARNIILEEDTDVEISNQESLQTVRNFVGWRRIECNTVESFSNLENVLLTDRQGYNNSNLDNEFEENTCFPVNAATNDTRRNTNGQFTLTTPNLATDLPCCTRTPKILNTDTDPFKILELNLQNDLSATSSYRHTRMQQNDDLRHSKYLFVKACNNQGFLKSHSMIKQKYYEKKKIDLIEFERVARNEVKFNNLSRVSETKKVQTTYNIVGSYESLQRMNINIEKMENSSENEFTPEAKYPVEPSAGLERQINQTSKTPESPVSALIKKNLSELCISKRVNLSQKEVAACGKNEMDCEAVSAEDKIKTNSKPLEKTESDSENDSE